MDLQTEYKYNTSIEMLEYMLSSHPYHQEPFQIMNKMYIGNYHRIERGEAFSKITRSKSKELFYKDIENIEKYHLLAKLKLPQNLYDVCVHFIYDYGKQVFKNSKFYFYIKTQNTEKILEELQRYKVYKNTMNKGSISRRNFDINLVKYNKYGTTKEHGNKKSLSRKITGFSF